MTRLIVRKKEKPIKTIVIDSEFNDDWMKILPGYQNELQIHEDISKKKKKKVVTVKKGGQGSGDFGHVGNPGQYGGSLPKDERSGKQQPGTAYDPANKAKKVSDKLRVRKLRKLARQMRRFASKATIGKDIRMDIDKDKLDEFLEWLKNNGYKSTDGENFSGTDGHVVVNPKDGSVVVSPPKDEEDKRRIRGDIELV